MPKARAEDFVAVLDVMNRAPNLTTHASYIARGARLSTEIVAAVLADLRERGCIIDSGLQGGAGHPRKYQLTPSGAELASLTPKAVIAALAAKDASDAPADRGQRS